MMTGELQAAQQLRRCCVCQKSINIEMQISLFDRKRDAGSGSSMITAGNSNDKGTTNKKTSPLRPLGASSLFLARHPRLDTYTACCTCNSSIAGRTHCDLLDRFVYIYEVSCPTIRVPFAWAAWTTSRSVRRRRSRVRGWICAWVVNWAMKRLRIWHYEWLALDTVVCYVKAPIKFIRKW